MDIVVSLQVSSTHMRLADLAAATGLTPGIGSHDIGDPRGKSRIWDISVINVDSPNRESDLHDQMNGLVEVVRRMKARSGLPDQLDIAIVIASFNRGPMSSVFLPSQLLGMLGTAGVGMEVVAYQVGDDRE